jgi:hypothetical protein
MFHPLIQRVNEGQPARPACLRARFSAGTRPGLSLNILRVMPICSSVENAEKLRLAQLLSTDSEAFFCVAVSVLRSDDEDARRYILRLLICEGQFLRFLCSQSELCTAECTEIMRTAAKLLPTADLKLARHLCDQANELHRESLLKLLDVLGSISRPARLSTVVSKLLLHSDAIVRSKAARLMNLSER